MEFIWYWFAYSFLGYCLEKLFAAATRSKHRLRRCFVFLPLCPVYGFAMLAILLLGAEDLPGAWEQLLLGTLVSTSVEYAVHWAYEKLFAVRFVQPVLADFAAQLSEEAALPAVFFTMFDGILSARVLLLTHDIDALTPRTLVTISRRTA